MPSGTINMSRVRDEVLVFAKYSDINTEPSSQFPRTNMSRIDNASLELRTPEGELISVQTIPENFNVIRIMGGMAGPSRTN